MAFDPSQPFELVEEPRFDPGKPFQLVEPPKERESDELGAELSGVVSAAERGARRFAQQGSVTGMRRVGELESQLQEAEGTLSKYDQDFPKNTNQRWRMDQVSRIAGIKGELERYREMAPELAQSFTEQQKKIEALPASRAQEEFQKPETPWWKFFADPLEITASVTAESLPSMVLGLAGAPLGPAGIATTMGASSFGAESSARVVGAMQQQGVDLQNPDAVLGWFKNRANAEPELAKADLAAMGPATFDALTAGIAGRWLKGAIGQGGKKVLAATGKEIGTQMAGGGVGSVAGSKLAGEKVDWKDVVLEMAAELAPGEAVSNVLAERAQANHLPATAQALREVNPVEEVQKQEEVPLVESAPEPAKPVEAVGAAPVPETDAAIAKQLEVTLDPQSTKAVTLVTPGSPTPTTDLIPIGLESVTTKHGIAIFNPAKTTREAVLAAAEGKDFDGTLLGMSQAAKPEPVGNTVVQTVKDGVPVLDEVVAPTPEAIAVATEAHKAAVPGGETTVVPAEKVLEERTAEVQSSPVNAPQTPTPDTPPNAPTGTLPDAGRVADRGTVPVPVQPAAGVAEVGLAEVPKEVANEYGNKRQTTGNTAEAESKDTGFREISGGGEAVAVPNRKPAESTSGGGQVRTAIEAISFKGQPVELRLAKERKGTRGDSKPKIGVATREYVAWAGGNPVDRFTLVKWKHGDKWQASTSDTTRSDLKALRQNAARIESQSESKNERPNTVETRSGGSGESREVGLSGRPDIQSDEPRPLGDTRNERGRRDSPEGRPVASDEGKRGVGAGTPSGGVSGVPPASSAKSLETKTPEAPPNSGRVAGPATIPVARQPREVKAAETPAKAQAKMQAEVTSVAKTEGARPAKEIKSELVQRLEAAIANAPAEPQEMTKLREGWDKADKNNRSKAKEVARDDMRKSSEKLDKVTIEIPGDGTFTVLNNKYALGELLRRAQKLSTSTTPPKGFTESGISKADSQWVAEQVKSAEKKPKTKEKEQTNENATETSTDSASAENRIDSQRAGTSTETGARPPEDAGTAAPAPASVGGEEVAAAEAKLASVVNESVDRASSKTKLGVSAAASARPTDVVLGAADLKSVSPTVEARWQAAVKGTQSVLDRLRESATKAWQSITREYAGLPPRDFPQEIDVLRRLRASRNASARTTVDVLKGITHNIGPKQYSVFNRVVLLEDLAKDIEAGKYADGRDLPFGYASATELQEDLSKFRAIAEATPEIREALAKRKEFMDALAQTLVSRGFLPESVLEDGRYFHHQVLLYMAEQKTPGGTGSFRDWFSGWQKARKGSSLDYNRQYVESEAEVVADALNKIAMQDLQSEMKRVADIAPNLKELHGEEWQQHIPKTHTKWQPKQGNVFYPVQTVAERVMEQYLAGISNIMPSEFREALAVGPKRPEWVIPKPLARVLDNLAPREDTWIDQLASAGISGWKKYILLNPLRAAKYNLNNLSGDLDFLMAAQPKIFGEFKQAAQDMWGFHVKGKAATGDIKEAMAAGVIGSGWRASELPDISKSDYFYWLTGDKPKLVDRYWNWIGKRNDAREDTGRLAAYRFAQKEWAAGRPYYGASVPADVDALATPQLKAAKVAREVLIDYGRETEFGEFMRRKFIPFYRWMHGNAARYMQLIANVKTAEGADAAAVTGAKLAGAALARKTATLGVRMAAAYALVNIWNHLFFPDEEEEMGEGRNQLHLILGRDEQGNIQTIRFQGALSDLLGWIGLENLPQDVEDLVKGHASAGDKMEDAYEAGISRVVNSSQPFGKTLAEVGLGRSFYPNALEPRPIRDKAEHAAGLFSLGNVYQWLAGKPHKPLTREVANLIAYSTDPGEAAYNATRHMASEWMEDNGEERANVIPGKRSNALYYYKQALRYKDKGTAEKFLAEYKALGGKQEGLRVSIEKSDPLAMLGKKRGDFLKTLSPEERATVARAEAWYRKVYRP